MPIRNRIADLTDEIAAWRHDFHAHPELLFDVHRTAGRVAELLTSFGVDEVVTGIGRTGVVALVHGKGGPGGRVIGLRADMDALPIAETSGKPHASTVPGKMHACGHDGHTAMLLGAAKYLSETRQFAGTVALIFQPAEEGGGGGRAMVEDGLMDRFGIEEVYGLHNWPGMPLGQFGIRHGGIMAATDEIRIEVSGIGGHAALPHLAVDPVLVAAHIVTGLQSIVSRNIDPMRSAVLSITMIAAGEASNIISQSARLRGTVRTLDEDVRTQMEQRITQMVPLLAQGFGARAEVTYRRGYPVTVNAVRQADFAADVASLVAGPDRVNREVDPSMGAEDFSYMASARPGAFIFLGVGDGPKLHQSNYDFNDEVIPYGTSYWVTLVEQALPLT